MPLSDLVGFIGKIVTVLPPLLYDRIKRSFSAQLQKWRYKSVTNPKVILVVGGSFAGIELVRRLLETIPTGYEVILIEQNSHFHWSFAFPRVTVLPGSERSVFIPYDGISRHAPQGIFRRVQGMVTDVQVEMGTSNGVKEKQVLLSSGQKVRWDILAIATGSKSSIPSKLKGTEKVGNCHEFEVIQQDIRGATSIAVIGGGAVGVELAADIRTYYPEKKVTLVHSHERLLNRFGPRLGAHALEVLREIGVTVVLGERPSMEGDSGNHTLVYHDGRQESFDLLFSCVGQTPNSSLLASFAPGAINPMTKRILVNQHLRIVDNDKHLPLDDMYALGDVAEHGGPLMGRAGYIQSDIVNRNILANIRNRSPLAIYEPRIDFEGAIGLTMGKGRVTQYLMDEKGHEILLASHKKRANANDELNMRRIWKMFGERLES